MFLLLPFKIIENRLKVVHFVLELLQMGQVGVRFLLLLLAKLVRVGLHQDIEMLQ